MKPSLAPHRLAPVALALALTLSACGKGDPAAMLGSARDYLAKNDNAAAVIQLKNALQQDPNLAEARLLLGGALLATGDAVGAQTELQKALDLGASPNEVLPLMVRSRLAQGQAKEVTTQYAATRLDDPAAQATLHTLLATAWLQQGQAKEAQAALEQALKLQPDHPPAVVELARQKAIGRDLDGALSQLDALLAKHPNDADAQVLRGDIFLTRRAAPDALAAFQAGAKSNPNSADALAGVVRAHLLNRQLDEATTALQALEKAAPGRPQTVYLGAQLALMRNELPKARELTQALLKALPNYAAAQELAGAVEFQSGAWVQAETHLARAIQLAPSLPMARRLLVMTYLRTGQTDRAIATLPADLNRPDVDAAMLGAAGQAWLVKGDAEQAQRYFARAVKLDPNDPAKRTTLALSQLAAGQTGTAFEALESIAAKDEGTVADLALINAHLQRREFDKALAAIDALAKKQPKEPLPLQLRGRVLLQKGDLAGARAAFEQALALDADYYEALAALSAVDVREGKASAAEQRLREAVKRKPANAPAWLLLADVKVASGGTPQEITELLQKAVEAAPTDKAPRVALVEHLLRQNDAKGALSAAQAAAVAQPDVPEVLDALGRAHSAAGEFNQAMSTFGKLQGMLPNSPLPHLRMADAQARHKDPNAAMQSLRKALELQPDLLLAQRALAELALRNGKASDALAVAKTVQQQRPKSPAGYVMEGDVHSFNKAFGAAAQAYRNGLKQQPSAELAIKLHTALTLDGKGAEAERAASEWIKANPKDAAVSQYLGDRALAAKRAVEARAHYERVVALQPRNPVALNNLAWLLGQAKQPQAVEMAERAVAAAPNEPAFQDTLAVVLSDRGEHEKALEIQKKVVAQRPAVPIFKLNLAKIMIKAGDKSGAKSLLDELAAMGDKFGQQAEVAELRKGL